MTCVVRALMVCVMATWLGEAADAQAPALGTTPTITPTPGVATDDASGINARTAPGTRFRDCARCPEMIVIPAGSFLMGTSASEPDRYPDEGPQQQVSLRAFALGATPVTFAEWEACVAAGVCTGRPEDEGWGRGARPVINVSWDDARGYATWLSSRRPGATYRLPTEAEWEYAARAGTTTARWWGADVGRGNTNCRGCGSPWDNQMTAPVASFRANAFGLHDMLGNVYQWVEDCWNGTMAGRPSDERAVLTGDCAVRVVRGGSWATLPEGVRSGYRTRHRFGIRITIVGFRVAMTLTP